MSDHKQSRQTVLAVLASTVLLGSVGLSRAQSLSDTLAPCFEGQTFAVVRLDLTRIDIDAAFALAVEVVPETQANEGIAATLKQANAQLQEDVNLPQLLSAGITSVYLVFSVNDLPHFLVAVPVGAESNAAQAIEWLENADLQTLRKGNVIMAGPEALLSRWKNNPSLRRPDLDRVAAAAKPAAIAVLIAPDADTRRVADALLTSWPEPKLAISPGAIANGLQWAALTVTWPPQLSLNLHVEATDSTSAQALGQAIAGMLKVAASLPAASGFAPSLSSILAQLQPRVEGSALSLTLDQLQAVQLVADLLVPQVLQLREQARQVSCGASLRQLALGVHIYAADHDGKLPPSLQAIVDAGMLPAEFLTCEGRPYIYRGVDLPNLNLPPMLILVHDSARAHRGGRNVAFVDGHVEWTREEHFGELIARDNQLRREHGLPEKPAE